MFSFLSDLQPAWMVGLLFAAIVIAILSACWQFGVASLTFASTAAAFGLLVLAIGDLGGVVFLGGAVLAGGVGIAGSIQRARKAAAELVPGARAISYRPVR